MCIHCHVRNGPSYGAFLSRGNWGFTPHIRGYWSWSAFRLRLRRGEGNPAPWIMGKFAHWGFQLELDPFAREFRWEKMVD